MVLRHQRPTDTCHFAAKQRKTEDRPLYSDVADLAGHNEGVTASRAPRWLTEKIRSEWEKVKVRFSDTHRDSENPYCGRRTAIPTQKSPTTQQTCWQIQNVSNTSSSSSSSGHSSIWSLCKTPTHSAVLCWQQWLLVIAEAELRVEMIVARWRECTKWSVTSCSPSGWSKREAIRDNSRRVLLCLA